MRNKCNVIILKTFIIGAYCELPYGSIRINTPCCEHFDICGGDRFKMFPFYKVREKCDHHATGKIPILCKTRVQPFDQFRIGLRIGCAGHIRERYFEILIVCQRSPDTCKLKWTIDIVYHCKEHCEQLKKI